MEIVLDLREQCVILPDVDYTHGIDNTEHIVSMAKRVGIHEAPEEKEGNILVFYLDEHDDSHLGIRVDGRRFLHIHRAWGSVITRIDGYWRKRLIKEYDPFIRY